MNKREDHAIKLLEAASTLDPVDLSKDPHPQINLQAAYDVGMAAWRGMESYGTSQERAQLRTSLLAVRALNQAITEGRRVFGSDNDKLRKASEDFRAVAMRVWPQAVLGRDDRGDTNQVSPVGLRFRSLRELAGAKPFVVLPSVKVAPASPTPLRAALASGGDPIDDDIQRLEELQKFRAKLPRTVKPGDPFVAVRMPLLVYTKSALNQKALTRAGIKFFELRNFGPPKDTATVDKKLARERGWAYVLENQLVIGMRHDEVADKKGKSGGSRPVVVPIAGEKYVPFKNLDSRLRRQGFKRDSGAPGDLDTTARGATIVRYRSEDDVKYVLHFKDGDKAVEGKKQRAPVVVSSGASKIPGAASRAVTAVSNKLGPHTNPLSMNEPADGLIRSPGSHLTFMWLAPNHELQALGSLVVQGVSFPWRELESAEQRDVRLKAAQRELRTLQEQQDILAKHKRVLEPEKLRRMSELRELLDRSVGDKAPLSQDEKKAQLERLKAELDAEVKSKNADLLKQIEDLKEDLEDEEDPKEKRAIQKTINGIQQKIDRSREVLAVKYRNKM